MLGMKEIPKSLLERLKASEARNNAEYEEALKEFSFGDRVEYHKPFGWVPAGSKGTVTVCRTGNGQLVVTLDGETGDNTYQLSKEYVRHIKS